MSWSCGFLLIILLIGSVIIVVSGLITLFSKKKKAVATIPSVQIPSTHIESIQNGSLQIESTNKTTTIRLSGGTHFTGTINGKKIEIKVPANITLEEIILES